jgi:GTP-binding protein YchF
MLRAALIGLPSTGKTTLFQLMTAVREAGRSAPGRGDVQVGISKVPDDRLDRLSAMFNPRKHVPATVEFADQAGAQGGAKTLVDVAAYKNADALVHVVRAFRSAAVPHVHESVNPARDAQAMEDELILADLGVVERRLERLEKDLKKSKAPDLEKERDLLTRCRAALESGTPLRALNLAGDDLKRLRGFQLLSAKPLLLVINLDEADVPAVGGSVEKAAAQTGLTAFLSRAATLAVPVCAKIELEIADLDAADSAAFLADLGLEQSGLNRVIRATYDLLGYMSFFTVGEDECRAWSIPRGMVAQLAAGEIHSDIQRGFIRAEVVQWDELLEIGSWTKAKELGKIRLEGKDYIAQDGDVMEFRFNV